MDKPRFILDSNAIIGHLNNQFDLEAILMKLSPCETYINLVVEIEVLAKAGMSKEEEVRARMYLSGFQWAEIDQNARDVAVNIRRARGLLLPDALIAASAITLHATMLSNDPHLRDFRWEGYKALPIVSV